jgi:signal recognition particle receptor subunit beta
LPFIVAVNRFDGAPIHAASDLRQALALPNRVPMIEIDARNRESAKQALITITEYALERIAAAALY